MNPKPTMDIPEPQNHNIPQCQQFVDGFPSQALDDATHVHSTYHSNKPHLSWKKDRSASIGSGRLPDSLCIFTGNTKNTKLFYFENPHPTDNAFARPTQTIV